MEDLGFAAMKLQMGMSGKPLIPPMKSLSKSCNCERMTRTRPCDSDESGGYTSCQRLPAIASGLDLGALFSLCQKQLQLSLLSGATAKATVCMQVLVLPDLISHQSYLLNQAASSSLLLVS